MTDLLSSPPLVRQPHIRLMLVVGMAAVLAAAVVATAQNDAPGPEAGTPEAPDRTATDDDGTGVAVDVLRRTPIPMRDGTMLADVTVVRGDATGLQCTVMSQGVSVPLRLGWNALDPIDAYNRRQALNGTRSLSPADATAFAEWCRQHDELKGRAVGLLERVLRVDPSRIDARRMLAELGYVFDGGRVYAHAEWERRARPQPQVGDPTGAPDRDPEDPAPAPAPTPSDPPPPGPGPPVAIRIALAIAGSTDWGEFSRFSATGDATDNPAARFEAALAEELIDRGYQVVGADENPTHTIETVEEGTASLVISRVTEFMDTILIVDVQAAARLRIRGEDNNMSHVTQARYEASSNDLTRALDGAMSGLADRVGLRVARAFLRR